MTMRASPPVLLLGAACSIWLAGRGLAYWWISADEAVRSIVAARLPAEVPVGVLGRASTSAPPTMLAAGVSGRDLALLAVPQRPRRVAAVTAGSARLVAPSVTVALGGQIDRANWQMLATALPDAFGYGRGMRSWPNVADSGVRTLSFADPMVGAVAAPAAAAPASTDARWSLSAWAVFRPDGRSGNVVVQPLLGGSQAGARLAYAIDRRGRASAYLRVVSAGRLGDGAEGAAGIAVRPVARLPVTLAVERRQRIAGASGRSGFAALATVGVSDVALGADLRADGYAATGVVAGDRGGAAGFVEGQAAVRRPVARVGGAVVELGLGAWGAAQPGVARLDVGPRLSVQPGGGAPRAMLDWRQRVAGNAAPASGPVLTVGWDF